MPSIEWIKPAPLWADEGLDFKQPQIVKLMGDNFLPDFLAAMAGQAPADYLGSAERRFDEPEDRSDGRLKLYQPAHGRYYLVLGSLVCRQLGLPDRMVARKNGERTSFVLRRIVEGGKTEQGWVEEGPNRGWRPLVDAKGRPVLMRADEERFPMHPIDVRACATPAANPTAGALALSTCGQRTIYYGYIAAGNREKYLEPYLPPSGDPARDLEQLFDDALSQSDIEGDPRVDEIDSRVITTWRELLKPALPPLLDARIKDISLFLLLDLGDFVERNLPGVFAAILQGSGNGLSGDRKALYDEINRIAINTTDASGFMTLAQAIKELKTPIDYFPLTRGQGPEPPKKYDLLNAPVPTPPPLPPNLRVVDPSYLAPPAPPPPGTPGSDTLYKFFSDALAEEKTERVANGQPWLAVPPEVAGLLSDQVKVDPPESDVPNRPLVTYYLRLVYEHDPCAPVVSPPSAPLIFAKFFDPDAPARHIRIELPDIKNLRRFKRGVGMQMTPELRDIMNRVNKDMLKGNGLDGSPGGWELGMICSFSLQIIFLVAFIVMFIFLILLNIVFWWLPFLKICFPIPKKAGGI